MPLEKVEVSTHSAGTATGPSEGAIDDSSRTKNNETITPTETQTTTANKTIEHNIYDSSNGNRRIDKTDLIETFDDASLDNLGQDLKSSKGLDIPGSPSEIAQDQDAGGNESESIAALEQQENDDTCLWPHAVFNVQLKKQINKATIEIKKHKEILEETETASGRHPSLNDSSKHLKSRRKTSIVVEAKHVNRINREHSRELEKLITRNTNELFGDCSDVDHLLLSKFISIGVNDHQGCLVGAMSFQNYPNIPAIDPSDWTHWIREIYGIRHANPRNTLWIHLLAYQEAFETSIVAPILDFIFTYYWYVEYFYMVVPPGSGIVQALTKVASRLYPKKLSPTPNIQSLYEIKKSRVFEGYKIRQAETKDNDDLIPMLDELKDQLTEFYGQYYAAEILMQKNGREILVTEHEGRAVSVMIVNRRVNYIYLNHNFELTTFNGLRKIDKRDAIQTLSDNVLTTTTISIEEASKKTDTKNKVSSGSTSSSLLEDLGSTAHPTSVGAHDRSEKSDSGNYYTSEDSYVDSGSPSFSDDGSESDYIGKNFEIAEEKFDETDSFVVTNDSYEDNHTHIEDSKDEENHGFVDNPGISHINRLALEDDIGEGAHYFDIDEKMSFGGGFFEEDNVENENSVFHDEQMEYDEFLNNIEMLIESSEFLEKNLLGPYEISEAAREKIRVALKNSENHGIDELLAMMDDEEDDNVSTDKKGHDTHANFADDDFGDPHYIIDYDDYMHHKQNSELWENSSDDESYVPSDIMKQKWLALQDENDQEELQYVSPSDSGDFTLVFTSSDLYIFGDDVDDVDISLEDESFIQRYSKRKQSSPGSADELLTALDKARGLDVVSSLTYVSMVSSRNRYLSSKTKRLPKFYGNPNAFAIEAVAYKPGHRFSICYMLQAVFRLFPKRELCVLHKSSDSEMEQWVLDAFNRVVPRMGSIYPYDLFVCHRSSIIGRLSVEKAKPRHKSGMKMLSSTLPTRHILNSYVNLLFPKDYVSPYEACIFKCGGTMIGFAIVIEEYHIDHLECMHKLKHWSPVKIFRRGNYGVIDVLLLSPMFNNAGRFFKQELHRLLNYDVLFYKRDACEVGQDYERPVMNILNHMQPVLPRKTQDFDYERMIDEGYVAEKAVVKQEKHAAIYISTLSLCSIQKVVLDIKIVVVNSNTLSDAFFEALLFRHLNYNYKVEFSSLTVICRDGFRPKIPKKIKNYFQVHHNFHDWRFMDMVSLETYVNGVAGVVTDIDRDEKLVIIDNCRSLSYDVLYLMWDEEFQKPLKNYRHNFLENPNNLFIINNLMDMSRSIDKIRELQGTEYYSDGHLIVYGHSLEAYSCLAGLLKYGIPQDQLVLVDTFPYNNHMDGKDRQYISMFNDPDIYHAVVNHIDLSKIQFFRPYYLKNWLYNAEDNLIEEVTFESKHHMLRITCQAIFVFHEKNISSRAYRVIEQSKLLFDGRLVIDKRFRTNDKNIYAAGQVTKYSRKHYASPDHDHRYYNEQEIGYWLGVNVRSELLPSYVKRFEVKKKAYNFHMVDKDKLVPIFDKPLLTYCELPGPLYYLSVTKPGRQVALESASSTKDYGRVLITGHTRNMEKQGLFKLHCNPNGFVQTVTCANRKPIDDRNLFFLWGKHERTLNNVYCRFEQMLITDFFEYFKKEWSYAVFHDKFDKLLIEVDQIMTTAVLSDEHCLVNQIIDMFHEKRWENLLEDEFEKLEDKFRKLTYVHLMEEKVFDFIQENLIFFPMYSNPVLTRTILGAYFLSRIFMSDDRSKKESTDQTQSTASS